MTYSPLTTPCTPGAGPFPGVSHSNQCATPPPAACSTASLTIGQAWSSCEGTTPASSTPATPTSTHKARRKTKTTDNMLYDVCPTDSQQSLQLPQHQPLQSPHTRSPITTANSAFSTSTSNNISNSYYSNASPQSHRFDRSLSLSSSLSLYLSPSLTIPLSLSPSLSIFH